MPRSRRVPVACGVDIGSTNVKVVLLDAAGEVVARVGRATPRRDDDLTIDARVLMDTVETLVRHACGTRFRIEAACSVGMGEDGVLVDANLDALTPALAWFDPRRQGIFERLPRWVRAADDVDVLPDPACTLVGWAWCRRSVAAAPGQSWIALADLPGVLWSGERFLSNTLASRTAAWRTGGRGWAAERVAATLGTTETIPPVTPVGEAIGPMRPTALLGSDVLAPDAIVVSGGHDHPAAGWCVEQQIPGGILDSMGTAEVVVAQGPPGALTDRGRLDVTRGILSDGVMLMRVEELSRNLRWAAQDRDVGAGLKEILDGIREPLPLPGAEYFIPGSHGGAEPSYSRDAPAEPFARASAVLWALARAGDRATEAVAKVLPRPAEVLMTGGWARSKPWLDIKASVSRRRTQAVTEPEVTAVGAALLAARARGWAVSPSLMDR